MAVLWTLVSVLIIVWLLALVSSYTYVSGRNSKKCTGLNSQPEKI
jgi:hypothetical protein